MPKPVPVRVWLATPPLVPDTLTVPVRAPVTVGLNTTDSVQVRPGARDALQPFVATAKSPVVVAVRVPVSCLLLALLVTVQTTAAEVAPTAVSSKDDGRHAMPTPGRSRAEPLTVRATDDTVPSVTVKLAEALPVMVGLKVTTTWQVAAGARAAWQVVV
jgi:hypothetical protein